ncbi:MAG: SUMF1/EgtB/PvdO family nonheme iron enzyme [Myxococcales bacterium]|nr:SUMF1/EgtB/PvdO family nonheme iron enzyme [Myxococcales bacterium]
MTPTSRALLSACLLAGMLSWLHRAPPSATAQPRATTCPAGAVRDAGGHCVGAHSCPSGMVPIPAGEFQMGVPSATDDRGPAHTEAVAAFCIDRLEVTTADYRACVARGGCTPTGGSSTCNEPGTERGQHPINCVSHPQAEAYCRQRGARLPTEAEWKKTSGSTPRAARTGDGTRGATRPRRGHARGARSADDFRHTRHQSGSGALGPAPSAWRTWPATSVSWWRGCGARATGNPLATTRTPSTTCAAVAR